MATLGIGVDIVALSRIEEALSRREGFLDRIYTPAERVACEGLADSTRIARLAARFAAKEAFYKALGSAQKGLSWQDVGVESDGESQPRLVPSGRAQAALEKLGATRVHLSLSHDGGVAIAMVLIEN